MTYHMKNKSVNNLYETLRKQSMSEKKNEQLMN